MKKITVFGTLIRVVASLSFMAVPALADTTVTVDQDKVTVNQNAANTVVTTSTPAPIVVAKTLDPRELEGEIIRVDIPESTIVVQDADGREKKVLLKQGMINQYKVGDYVQIYLMADMKEAKTVHVKKTADLEGKIIGIDRVQNFIILNENSGKDRNVLVRPEMIGNYKVGDHIRMYVVSDDPLFSEVKLIRVK